MNITKVRLKRSAVAIEWTTDTGSHAISEKERPLPSFVKAVEALAPLLIQILHLPASYAEKLTPTGITISTKQDVQLVTITAQKDLPECHSPFNLATPLRFLEHPKEEGSYSPALADRDVCLINAVVAEAKRYVAGERAQGNLPFNKDDEDEGDEDETPDNVLDLPGAATGRKGKAK